MCDSPLHISVTPVNKYIYIQHILTSAVATVLCELVARLTRTGESTIDVATSSVLTDANHSAALVNVCSRQTGALGIMTMVQSGNATENIQETNPDHLTPAGVLVSTQTRQDQSIRNTAVSTLTTEQMAKKLI